MGLHAVVQAPPATPARLGLLAAARQITGEEARWEQGFEFEPEECSSGGITDPCLSTAKTLSAGTDKIEYEPFVVWAGDRCSTFGFAGRDWQARAKRQLAACESKLVEEELWTGAQAISSAWPNRYLASEDSDVVGTGAVPPAYALACLEQALAECACGGRGMVHATPQVVTHWQAANLLRREGNLLLTYLDTIVVPGQGYDGSGPLGQPAANGGIWAYATSLVDVRLGPIQTISEKLVDNVDRSVNTLEYRAERSAAASWGGCCHAAVEIDLDLCGIAGPGS